MGCGCKRGVNKRFTSFDPNQVMIVPPSLDEWLPEVHLSRFIAEIVDGNAMAESSFSALNERIYRTVYATKTQARELRNDIRELVGHAAGDWKAKAARYSRGVIFLMSLNRRLKLDRFMNPQSTAIDAMERSAPLNKRQAALTRTTLR